MCKQCGDKVKRVKRYEVHRRGYQWVVYACYYDGKGSGTGVGYEVRRFYSRERAINYMRSLEMNVKF